MAEGHDRFRRGPEEREGPPDELLVGDPVVRVRDDGEDLRGKLDGVALGILRLGGLSRGFVEGGAGAVGQSQASQQKQTQHTWSGRSGGDPSTATWSARASRGGGWKENVWGLKRKQAPPALVPALVPAAPRTSPGIAPVPPRAARAARALMAKAYMAYYESKQKNPIITIISKL